MAAASGRPHLANSILVYPVNTTANGSFIQIGNQDRKVSRSKDIGAIVIFKTEEAARGFFETLRNTEMRVFGRSIGRDGSFENYKWYVDIHGNAEAILPVIQRGFPCSISKSQGNL